MAYLLTFYRFQIFGQSAPGIILSVAYFAAVLWGTIALWFSPAQPATRCNTTGLVVGLLAWAPGTYWFVFPIADSSLQVFVIFGWVFLPPLVAIALLSARLFEYLNRH